MVASASPREICGRRRRLTQNSFLGYEIFRRVTQHCSVVHRIGQRQIRPGGWLVGQEGNEVYVLGPLKVMTDGGPVPINAKRLRAVLAILLLHANSVCPSIASLTAFFGRVKRPRSAVENIRTYIWQLRSLLRENGSWRPAGGAFW